MIGALAMVPVVVVVSLSDRALLSSGRVLAGGRYLTDRVADRLGFELGPVDLPFPPDAGVHLLLWAAAGFFAHRLLGDRVSALVVLWTLAAASFALEVGQVFFTSSRSFELSDMAANVVGVLVGVTAAATYAWFETRRDRAAAAPFDPMVPR